MSDTDEPTREVAVSDDGDWPENRLKPPKRDVVQQQNDRGEWVPAIPEPLFVGFGLRKARCDCGETRRNRASYREHYALAHILALS